MDTAHKVAKFLLDIGAVKFVPEEPITFKSGIKSPIYIDNRELPFHPLAWRFAVYGFKDLIDQNSLSFDVVAGVAAGGIPHSAALAFLLERPSIFVRKEAKEHGRKERVEGGNVKGKTVLLIEDLISTGGSSLSAVEALREAGAIVEDCVVIVSYDFPEANEAFKKANVMLHHLTSFPVILEEAEKLGKISDDEKEKIKEWFSDPHGWAKKYGY